MTNTRKKTISLLLAAAMALSAAVQAEERMPAILPDEYHLELLQETPDKTGKKRKRVL